MYVGHKYNKYNGKDKEWYGIPVIHLLILISGLTNALSVESWPSYNLSPWSWPGLAAS